MIPVNAVIIAVRGECLDVMDIEGHHHLVVMTDAMLQQEAPVGPLLSDMREAAE